MPIPQTKSFDVILEGKLSWHNLVAPDPEGLWKVKLYMTPESVTKFNELKEEGLLNVLKKDDDGYSAQFKRYQNRTIRGKIVAFSPPIVLDAEGRPREGMGIGHGSDVKIKLQAYRYNPPSGKKGLAVRLEAVRIMNLVPYDHNRDLDTLQMRQMKGLGEPTQVTEAIW
jgi:hypothetical protein